MRSLHRHSRHAITPRAQRLPLALAAACLFTLAGPAAQAQGVVLPQGPNVVRGSASFGATNTSMTVKNSNGTIIDWRSFSIGDRGTVRFDQANAQSQVLNRVVGNDPSRILGSLQSNGKVWLLNPHGVLFGKGATVDVAGLVASTLSIGNDDWAAGKHRLVNTLSGDGDESLPSVVNEGRISALGGRIALVAGNGGVTNRGVIEASGGQVLLAAGQSVDLIDTGAPNITLRVASPQGQVLNLGQVLAPGGRIDAQAAIVNQQGLMRADALAAGAGGEIVLRASSAIGTSADSITSADAQGDGDGGHIVVSSDGQTRVSGRLSARGSGKGNGGRVETAGATLDARSLTVDAGADKGRAGQWLAQAGDIRIAEDASATPVVTAAAVAAPPPPPVVTPGSIETALNGGTDVKLVATGTGSEDAAGDITISGAGLNAVPGRDVSLSLEAARDIDIRNSTVVNGDGAALSLSLQAGRIVSLSDSTLRTWTGRSTIGVEADSLMLGAATINSDGRIRIAADQLRFDRYYSDGDGDGDRTARITSAAAGDAIVVSGRRSDGVTSIVNNADPNVLDAPKGRWLFYAASPAVNRDPDSCDCTTFALDELPYAFSQHGASFAKRAESGGNIVTPAPGNGLLYAAAPNRVTFDGTATKTYDGNDAGTIARDAIRVSGGLLPGERAVIGDSVAGTYDSRNTDARTFTPRGGAVGFIDAQERPVFGYDDNLGPLQGRITPAPLTLLGASAADKNYDARTAARITSVSLGGMVGDEQLGFVASGEFDDANAGTGKTVRGNVTALSDGSNGGLARNYTLRGTGGFTTTATIAPAPLTVSATAADKTYDAKTAAQITSFSFSGLVGSEQLGAVASGAFDDPNAGVGKTVRGSVSGLSDGANGGLARNYTLRDAGFTTTATISPAELTVLAASAADKTYDATTAARITSVSFAGLVGSEQVGFAASGAFDDANAGVGKTVRGRVSGLSDGANGGLASNYTLRDANFTTTATISPAQLSVLAASAADKTYDTGTAAQITSVSLRGLVGSEQLGVAASGAFDDADAGVGKTVRGNVTALSDGANGGRAGNYTLRDPAFTTNATIAPATLTYRADSTTWSLPAITPLTGSVTGLLGEQTLADATTGTLTFTAPAEAATRPGTYAVLGGGLAARNYVFVQDESNATALSVNLRAVGGIAVERVAPFAGYELFPQPPTQPAPTKGAATDVSPWVGTSAFDILPIGGMSQQSLSSMLSARERYKAHIFAEAIARLEREPGLADSPDCETPQQVETGDCLITETLKREMAGRSTVTQAEATPTPAAPAADATATAPAVAAVVAATDAASTSAEEQAAAFAAKRRVKSATLPQIERKVAVLIGIDQHADARIPKLANAANDARTVGQVLDDRLGYETVVLANASKKQVVRTLNQLALTLGPKDSVVIYYAGHGQLVPATGLGYWQPADADASKPETWLSNADIGKLVSRLDASQLVLVSDSCYSGSLVSEERIRPLAASADPAALLNRRAAVVMSSGGNEPVFDDGKNGHSLFAFGLMQSLRQVPTWQAGGNVFERVRFAVAKELPQRPRYGAALTGGHEAGADYVFEKRELE